MARERRDAARKLLTDGVDPGEHREASKAAREGGSNTFEVIAREWFAKFSVKWTAGHASKVLIAVVNQLTGNNPGRRA